MNKKQFTDQMWVLLYLAGALSVIILSVAAIRHALGL